MTTAALSLPAGRDERPGLARLTLVELRKMTDTRAGFWLLLVVLALTVLVVLAFAIWADEEVRDYESMLAIGLQPASILLPVVGILLVASEWSQRTAQITFALVPHRMRVVAAKLLAGIVLALAALVFAMLMAVIGTVVAGASDAWSIDAKIFGQLVFYVVTAMIGGIAFGALFLASAPAIVLYFVAPIAWSIVGSFSFFKGPAEWLDSSRTIGPMVEEVLSAGDWAKVGTTLLVWMVLPLAIGMWRISRGDPR